MDGHRIGGGGGLPREAVGGWVVERSRDRTSDTRGMQGAAKRKVRTCSEGSLKLPCSRLSACRDGGVSRGVVELRPATCGDNASLGMGGVSHGST